MATAGSTPAIVFATVVVYVVFTLKFSGWRMQFRHEMNRLDSLANGRAVDSLLNYETVKYFGNERLEIDAYDTAHERLGGRGRQESGDDGHAQLRSSRPSSRSG